PLTDVNGPIKSYESFSSNEDSDSDNSARGNQMVNRRISTSSSKSAVSCEENIANPIVQSESSSNSENSHTNGTKFTQIIKNEMSYFPKKWDEEANENSLQLLTLASNQGTNQLKQPSELATSRKEINHSSSGKSDIISSQQESSAFNGDPRHQQSMIKCNDTNLLNIGSTRQETELPSDDDHPLQQLSELALGQRPNSERSQYQPKNFENPPSQS
ncbi:5825_t:CDS:1, partial [Acaulospora colombiana]